MPKVANVRKAGNGNGLEAPAKAKVITLKGAHVSMKLALGFGRATPTQGGPVIEETARPQRKPLTTYMGSTLVKLDVPVLLDSTNAYQDPNGLGYRQDVWPIVERIFDLTRPRELGEGPPPFKISGPVPFAGLTCLMEWPELTTEPEPWVLGDGTVIRQALVLKLVEYIDPDPVHIGSNPRVHEGSIGAGGFELHVEEVQKQGETLQEFAARLLNDPTRAKEIGDLNGIRDPTTKLKKGRKLQMPTRRGG